MDMDERAKAYNEAGEEVSRRILALLPEHPELAICDVEKGMRLLLEIPEFDVDDIGPTMFQVGWALQKARYVHEFGQEVWDRELAERAAKRGEG